MPKPSAAQEIPLKTRSRNVEAVVAGKQVEQKRVAESLAAVGFKLSWQPTQEEIRFRQLQAEPLVGAVAGPPNKKARRPGGVTRGKRSKDGD